MVLGFASAVIAWVRSEPEADAIRKAVVEAPLLFMSAFNCPGNKTVLLRRFPGAGFSKFEVFFENLDVRILAFDMTPIDASAKVRATPHS